MSAGDIFRRGHVVSSFLEVLPARNGRPLLARVRLLVEGDGEAWRVDVVLPDAAHANASPLFAALLPGVTIDELLAPGGHLLAHRLVGLALGVVIRGGRIAWVQRA